MNKEDQDIFYIPYKCLVSMYRHIAKQKYLYSMDNHLPVKKDMETCNSFDKRPKILNIDKSETFYLNFENEINTWPM